MKSTKNTRAVTVGIFIFLALAIFIAGVLTLGGQRKTFGNMIEAKAIFNDVNGLQAGNNIWFAGVKIGTVKDIKFNPYGQVEVGLNIEEKSKQFIRSDAKAKIGTDGLIGNKIIVLYGGTQQAPPIKEGDVLRVDSAVGMDEMMNTLQANNKNLLDITSDFKVVSKKLAEGQGSIGKLLNDETLANALQAAVNNLNRASVNAAQLTNNISAYTSKLQKKGSLANDLVTDTIVFNRLRSSVAEFQNVAATANDVVANLKSATSTLNTNLNSANSPAGVLLNDQQSAENLKAILKNLESGTKKLDENMEAMQHNFLFRGYFKKKSKEKPSTP
jgi:phospholipid/cholesterol/gamma-HCH transport system substrate-binding protein